MLSALAAVSDMTWWWKSKMESSETVSLVKMELASDFVKISTFVSPTLDPVRIWAAKPFTPRIMKWRMCAVRRLSCLKFDQSASEHVHNIRCASSVAHNLALTTSSLIATEQGKSPIFSNDGTIELDM